MISQGKNTYIIINSHIQKTSYTYDAFGTLVEGDLSGTKDYGYLGKQHDPTANLYNYGYRDYSPSQARFTTVDPIRDGTNWFSYCNGDPVNFVDLWGLFDYELKGPEDDPNHGPDINFFPHNQRIYDDVKLTPDTPNDYIVAGHGSPNSISDAKGNKMTAKEIADIIKSDPLTFSSSGRVKFSAPMRALNMLPPRYTASAPAFTAALNCSGPPAGASNSTFFMSSILLSQKMFCNRRAKEKTRSFERVSYGS